MHGDVQSLPERGGKYRQTHSTVENHQDEELVVEIPHAVGDPGTVMVHF
jgi:hypothetical protein